jgi:serine/threonine protein phosphatase 1
MRRFFTTDAHGGCKAIKQCLDMVNFDYEKDLLIYGGDIVDGWSESRQSIDLLMKIKNLQLLMGNHDSWFINYYEKILPFDEERCWLMHGGEEALRSYPNKEISKEHYDFIKNTAKGYYLTDDNKLFVHAGIIEDLDLEHHTLDNFIWNMSFTKYCRQANRPIRGFDEIYIGHTPTSAIVKNTYSPINLYNVWALDTAAAFEGCLTIIDIDTKEYWQSDLVRKLYPNERGRNRISWNEYTQLKRKGLI